MNSEGTEVQWLIKEIELFEGIKPRDVAKILNMGMVVPYEKGKLVFKKGQTGKQMYVILSGRVVIVDEALSHKKVVAVLEKGEVFGEMAFLSDAPRSASVLTTDKTWLLLLDEKKIQKILEKKVASGFLLNLIKMLCKRLRRTNALYLKATLKVPKPKDVISFLD